MFTHLHSVPVFVTDQARALRFFNELLGFEITMDAGDERFRWLTVAPKKDSETSLQLFQVSPGGRYGSPDWADRVGKHTGYVFYCEDIQKTYEELSEKGVRFTVAPQRQDWGGVEGTFVDPDGNGFELVEQPKIRVMK